MAHSLGCVITSNYIWDRQQQTDNDPWGKSAFERFETLVGIITFGCNIPWFVLPYDPVESITFPSPNLPDNLKQKALWHNFYDPDDILGYPLRPLSESYEDTVKEDIAIDVGGPLTAWNPLSHMEYWTDSDFTKSVANSICEFL